MSKILFFPVSLFLVIGLFVTAMSVLAEEVASTTIAIPQCEVVIKVVSRDDTKSFLLIKVQETKALSVSGCDMVIKGEAYQLTGGFFVGPPPRSGAVFSATVERGSKTLSDGSVKVFLRWKDLTPSGSSTSLGTMTGGALPFDQTVVPISPKPVDPIAKPPVLPPPAEDRPSVEDEGVQTITRAILDQNLADDVGAVKKSGDEDGTYLVTGTRAKKLFYLFPVTVPVEIVFDLRAGVALEVNLPWWSKLAF